jgi:hypothetical protein
MGFSIEPDGSSGLMPPVLLSLAMHFYVDHRIPDLPQACGPNCCYKVHVPSFVFNCTPNPSSLPYGQAGDESSAKFPVLWNGTTVQFGPNYSMGEFYIAWQSNGPNGTSGNALCKPFLAQYDIEVRIFALSTSLLLIFKLSIQGQDK